MYFWRKWDALKSVKYIVAGLLTMSAPFEAAALANRAAIPPGNFPSNINALPQLTNQQGAFS